MSRRNPAFEFQRATKRFGRLTALDALSLAVAPGTLFALVGPNGAGKTTAIGLLTGLLEPSEGQAFVHGIDVAKNPVAAKALVGFVPDRPYLWPKWTPRETLRFVGAVFGMRGSALEERIDTELSRFGIDAEGDAWNETLSHGTRQKVALAQAFLHDPELLILDEPMVGLDPIAQRRLTVRLRELTARGAAVLFTTHQLLQAEETADEAGLLIRGTLAAHGPPGRLQSTPLAGRQAAGSLSEVFFELTGTAGDATDNAEEPERA